MTLEPGTAVVGRSGLVALVLAVPVLGGVRRTVVDIIEKKKSNFHFVYEDAATLWDKVTAVATKIYGAADVTADAKFKAQIQKLQDDGY